jgi:starvation-inducible outer membrane lipoprotein
MKRILLVTSCAFLLAACGESPQPHALGKNDTAPYKGTGKPYVEKGWTQGDKASWESALKARAQNGQNDYSRMN